MSIRCCFFFHSCVSIPCSGPNVKSLRIHLHQAGWIQQANESIIIKHSLLCRDCERLSHLLSYSSVKQNIYHTLASRYGRHPVDLHRWTLRQAKPTPLSQCIPVVYWLLTTTHTQPLYPSLHPRVILGGLHPGEARLGGGHERVQVLQHGTGAQRADAVRVQQLLHVLMHQE